MNNFPNDLIPIGKISKPHGIKGELKVILYNFESTTLVKGLKVWFEDKNNYKNFILESIRGHSSSLIVKFKKINDIEYASLLKEKRIFVSRNDFPNLDEGCFYFNDFIGSKIIDKENNIFGRVVDIMMFPANEVLLVEYKNKEIMIPVVDDFVELFDFENNIIKVKNIKSLIEL